MIANFANTGTYQICTAGKRLVFNLMIDYAVKNNIFIVFRCHSFWIQDTIPYQQDRFKQRIYGYSKTKLLIDECETCQAAIYPYQKRTPCDAEKHIAACKPGCKRAVQCTLIVIVKASPIHLIPL